MLHCCYHLSNIKIYGLYIYAVRVSTCASITIIQANNTPTYNLSTDLFDVNLYMLAFSIMSSTVSATRFFIFIFYFVDLSTHMKIEILFQLFVISVSE